jgi:hypothetical protein
VAAAAGLFLTFLGPLGTQSASLLVRFAYWVGLAEGGTLIGATVRWLLARYVDPRDLRPYAMAGLTAVIMTAPTSALVWGATRLAFGIQGLFGGLPGVVAPVFVICLAMSLVQTLAALRAAPGVSIGARDAGPAPPPKFLDRLPPRLRGADLHAVQAEDHYLRLHTSRGQDLILMRLGDAVTELEGLEGARTHRSWWVARSAVADVRRGDGRATLVLTSGVEAPVSRNFFRGLREAGWF